MDEIVLIGTSYDGLLKTTTEGNDIVGIMIIS